MARLIVQAQLGFLALTALTAAIPVDNKQLSAAHIHVANAGLSITDNYHTLSAIQRKPGLSRTLDVLQQLRRNKAFRGMDAGLYPKGDPIGIDHLRAELNQIEYIMKVGVGPGQYYMIPDTGSSDTWVVQEGFRCLDYFYGDEIPQEDCRFGPQFVGDFPGGEIDNQNLNISYLGGDYLNGNMGYAEQVSNKYPHPRYENSDANCGLA